MIIGPFENGESVTEADVEIIERIVDTRGAGVSHCDAWSTSLLAADAGISDYCIQFRQVGA